MTGAPGLELWGGVECTLNRVGEVYHDQVARSGHDRRPDDLRRFAELGIRAIRQPVLWERVAPHGIATADWRASDERLATLRELGLRTIAGLVHHGSGPPHTSLVEESFIPGLVEYAQAVAERYPWIDDYTPVNEPLTTARFSALYGVWYPHARDPMLFARAVLIQCRAIVLAMRAIREVNPRARLVQTEDLGETHSTPTLAYQAEFENARRWVTYDLLTGRLGPGDPMWEYFRSLGVARDELAWFRDNPCPPDIIGVNHYLSSERFLDERVERYPPSTWGGNSQHRYADVEAARLR
ncbi:MAG: family 1 glycosylhydrolase, partial [Gemmatimonadota bacterium]|nr:family 1 glycosylhydrolase [Gemmatimonadota bacterium]